MTTEAAPEFPGINLELARVLHAALGAFLNGTAAQPDKLLYSPEEARERLGLESTNQLYRRTSDGTWPCTVIGGLKKFSEQNLEEIVAIQKRERIERSSRRRSAKT